MLNQVLRILDGILPSLRMPALVCLNHNSLWLRFQHTWGIIAIVYLPTIIAPLLRTGVLGVAHLAKVVLVLGCGGLGLLGILPQPHTGNARLRPCIGGSLRLS